MVYQATGAQNETEQAVLGVQSLHGIKQASDHVVTARSLTSTKDDTYVHRLTLHLLAGNKFYEGHAISIREKSLDLFLVVNTLCRSTFLHLYCTLQATRQLWLIGGSCNLQCTFFHNSCV